MHPELFAFHSGMNDCNAANRIEKKVDVSGHWSSFLGGKLNEIARARFLGLFFRPASLAQTPNI